MGADIYFSARNIAQNGDVLSAKMRSGRHPTGWELVEEIRPLTASSGTGRIIFIAHIYKIAYPV